MAVRPAKVGDSLLQHFTTKTFNQLIRSESQRARSHHVPPTPHQTVVRVVGNFSADVFSAVSISGPAYSPDGTEDSLENPYYQSVACAVTSTLDESWGVLQDYLADGQPARLMLLGVTWVKADIIDTDHTHVDVVDGALESTTAGKALILSSVGSVGQHLVLVLLGVGGSGVSTDLYRFTLTSGWTAGVASANIKDMDGTAVESSSVEDPDLLFSNLENGDDGLAIKQDDSYWVIAPDGGGSGGGSSLFRFSLTGAWTSGVANADITQMNGSVVESTTISDPEGIFASLGSGDTGLCLLQDSTYFAIQAGCPS
jgi:hypothetical protein